MKQTYVKGIPLSISFGVCTMKDMITDIENAIYIADKRMYREKEEKSVFKTVRKDVTVQKLRNTEYLAMIGRGIA